jgi:hypothetical protein
VFREFHFSGGPHPGGADSIQSAGCGGVPHRTPEQVFTTPPFLVIEILSPEDRWSRLTRKLEDYFAMGCPNIWIIDPVRSKAYRYDGGAVSEVHHAFSTADSSIAVQLLNIWQ